MYNWSMTTINATTLRNNLATALDEVKTSKKFMLVTNRGEITSALVDIDLFEDLLEASNEKYLDSVKKAREDIKKGRLFTHEEVFGKL